MQGCTLQDNTKCHFSGHMVYLVLLPSTSCPTPSKKRGRKKKINTKIKEVLKSKFEYQNSKFVHKTVWAIVISTMVRQNIQHKKLSFQ